jgi:predicted ATPase
MLTSVHIKNFRSCKDVKLEGLGPMVGLVGRNAAGKTTILEAIRQVAADALSNEAFSLKLEPGPLRVEENEVELEVSVTDHRYRYRLEGRGSETIDVRAETEPTWTRVVARDGQTLDAVQVGRRFTISREIAAMAALAAVLPQDDVLNQTLAPLRDVLSRVRYYPGHDVERDEKGNRAAEPSGLIHRDDFLHWAKTAKATEPSDPSILMRLLYAALRDPSRFDELERLMGAHGLHLLRGIRIKNYSDQAAGDTYLSVEFLPSGVGERDGVSLFALSGGTRRILYLLVGLLFDRRSVMLIEQPEDGIHPGLLVKVVDLLRVNADPTQIIIASHSPVVLSSMQPKDVRLVSIHDGSTEVRGLTDSELERAQKYMQVDGTLAEYLELIQED